MTAHLLLLFALWVGQRPSDASVHQQLVVVTTPAWDSVAGILQRYERPRGTARWRAVGTPIPIVVGQTGLAWDDEAVRGARGPIKREGDGKAPAGRFSLGEAFGFAPKSELDWLRMPYRTLDDGTECVDDSTSTHYNTVVQRGAVRRVDWSSSERMRSIDLYRLGVIVRYNARPIRRGRGSCIFLHIWRSAGSPTAGCTAMPAADLETVMRWLDPARHPQLVQLPRAEYQRLRRAWSLP
ncbi:MAG TPA: L,D-transpeptidase family protein [Gemmatimonadaceae bacterium]|nr:L,D-transpeptidase family protein [Gemmatimonadaceae bacterium]